MSKSLHFNFPNFEMTWEGLNEFLANNQEDIKNKGYGSNYGTEMVLYNTLISVDLAQLNPKFDFAGVLGYKIKKWSKLVNNYIDLNYLDLVKSEVVERERKKASSYNYTVHFDNSHGSGKDCLISLTFQRRVDEPHPKIIFTTRASELTKRFIFDLLLLQRMAEYIYGTGAIVSAELYMPFMYIHIESFILYLAHKGLDCLIPNSKGEYSKFQERVLAKYKEFMERDLAEIKYKVHKRSATHIRKLKTPDPMYAADLQIYQYDRANPKLINRLNQGLDLG